MISFMFLKIGYAEKSCDLNTPYKSYVSTAYILHYYFNEYPSGLSFTMSFFPVSN